MKSRKEKLRDELRIYTDRYKEERNRLFEGVEDIQRSFSDMTLLVVSSLIAILMIIGAAATFMWGPPRHFPVGTIVHIEEGGTLGEVAAQLEDRNVIRSTGLFVASVRYLYNGDDSVVAGDYFFSQRHTLFSVAEKITSGDYGLDPLAVTIPEGASVREMANILEGKLDSFNKNVFIGLALSLEGYLFPDTYHFLPNTSERRAIEVMNENFKKKIAELDDEIETSGYDLHEIVTMASIIEKESENNEQARRTISGVLWKRIEMGMPLQVDAVFPYIIGRNTFELSLEDLKVDSPYNTYRYPGLPPGPISNPGLASIEAALNPIKTEYLFYLADLNGRTHFAETFEEHKWNKARYLD
ncbi:MAG: endolytic transglycosylase MltG [Candidatus Paceibacterota bacterium]